MGTRQNRILSVVALIWIAFIARGAFYATILPIWEGFDEHEHFAYLHHLKTFGSLPRAEQHVSAEISESLKLAPLPWSLRKWPPPAVTHDAYWSLSAEERASLADALARIPQTPPDSTGAEFIGEAKQPPLYYLLASLVLKSVSGQSLSTRILVLRLLSVLIVSLVIPLTFTISQRVFAATEPALMVTILIASMPGFLISVSRVANDCLAILLFTVLAYALLRPDPWDGRGVFLIGATLGAGLLAKAYFIAAFPAVLWSAIEALLGAHRSERARSLVRISAALMLTLVIAGWWYVRTLGGNGPVWVDAAPLIPVSAAGLFRSAVQMDWWEGIKVILNTHVWIGGWSFLSVRGWMYAVFRVILLAALLGGFLRVLRERARLPVLLCLYAGFWAALLYHAFVNWVNFGIPTSTGWYLHAVIACEATIICSGFQWLGPSLRGYAMATLTALFLLLETYATHFVLIPYYIGLINHRPDTTLASFYISQAVDLGWREILMRLSMNKPDFVGPVTVSLLWAGFVLTSVLLFVLACSYVSDRGQKSKPSSKRRSHRRR